jgi:hypothetical protein
MPLDQEGVILPSSASDEEPDTSSSAEAYLKNPIAGKEFLTPVEALRGASILLAMLEADEYRVKLEARRGPCGI